MLFEVFNVTTMRDIRSIVRDFAYIKGKTFSSAPDAASFIQISPDRHFDCGGTSQLLVRRSSSFDCVMVNACDKVSLDES
jgi:hypothetical protein